MTDRNTVNVSQNRAEVPEKQLPDGGGKPEGQKGPDNGKKKSPKGYKIPLVKKTKPATSDQSRHDTHGNEVQGAHARNEQRAADSESEDVVVGLDDSQESSDNYSDEQTDEYDYSSGDEQKKHTNSNRKRHGRHSHRHRRGRDKDSSSDPSSSDSYSSEERSSTSSCGDRKKRRKSTKKLANKAGSHSKFRRFDPCAEQEATSWTLSKDQEQYVEKQFTQFYTEEMLTTKVLKDCPIPRNEIFKVPVLEDEMIELLPYKIQEGVKKSDHGLTKILTRIAQVAGPLGKTWSRLEEASENPNVGLDAAEMMELVEKSFLLLGQAFVWGNYARRFSFLNRLMRSHKRAHKAVKQNDKLLAKNREDLFGKKFYKALHRKAQGSKTAQEIRRGFMGKTGGIKRRRPFRNESQSYKAEERGDRGRTPPNVVSSEEKGPEVEKQGMLELSSNKTTIQNGMPPPLPRREFPFENINPQDILPEVYNIGFTQPPLSSKPVGGRIKQCLENWEKITQDRNILEVVKGYRIEWIQTPVLGNKSFSPKFSKQETDQINVEVGKMIEKNAIVDITMVGEEVFLSHIFLREKKDGGFRPVFNLKRLNNNIPYQHFKMETTQMLKNLMQPNDWMVKIDLKDAYFTVPMAEETQKFLGFKWGAKFTSTEFSHSA